MFTKFIAIILFLSTTLLSTGATVSLKDEWFRSKNPFTVAMDSRLYTVSSYHKGYLDIYQSLNQLDCIIELNPVKENITGKYKAAALYHKIVIWGRRNEELVSDGSIRRTNYTFMLVDPKLCTRYALSDLVDEVPSSYPNILPEVMTHQDSFDIFFPSQKKCSPCSYDVNGEKIPHREQLKHEGSPKSPFYLREIGVTNKYIYLYNLDNITAAIRSINSRFEDRFYPPRKLIINATVNNLAVMRGDGNPYGGISYVLQGSPRRPYFLLFNEDLHILYSTHLPLLDYYDYIDSSITMDSRSYSYVTLIQQSGETRKITRVLYAPNGRIMSNFEMYKLEPKTDYDIQTFVVDNQYCLAIHQLSGTLQTKIIC